MNNDKNIQGACTTKLLWCSKLVCLILFGSLGAKTWNIAWFFSGNNVANSASVNATQFCLPIWGKNNIFKAASLPFYSFA